MKNKAIKIPFADETYLVYEDGSIYSCVSGQFVKGRCLSEKNRCRALEVRVNGEIKNILIHRIVYYLFRYAQKNTFEEFSKMPLVNHIDKHKLPYDQLQNLKLFSDRTELGKHENKRNPRHAHLKDYKRHTSIPKHLQQSVIDDLKEGKSMRRIAKRVGTSDISIHRFKKTLIKKGVLLKVSKKEKRVAPRKTFHEWIQGI